MFLGKRGRQRKNGLTMLVCGLEAYSQRLRYWYATKKYEWSWSCAELHSDPTITPDYGNNDDDGDLLHRSDSAYGTKLLSFLIATRCFYLSSLYYERIVRIISLI